MKTKTIDTTELKEWLSSGKKVTVLDVRNDADRNEWKIPQSVHYNIIDKIKSGDPTAVDGIELDKDIPIVTVCNAGNASKIAANLLTTKGFDTYSLKGGMKAWNYAWDIAEIALSNVKIIQIRRMAKGCLSYIIGSGKEAMVIDASLDPEVYIDIAKSNGWKITKVTDTHIHADYVSRSNELAKAVDVDFLMIAAAVVDYNFTVVKDGEILNVGNTKIKVLHTPGHTWESTSFLIDGEAIFTGDTIFTDGIGRPDLKADNKESIKKADALYESLQGLSALKADTLVLPAHISEPISIGQDLIAATIAELQKTIPALSLQRDVFISSTLKNLPDAPPNYLIIAQINKSGDRQDFVLADLEAGANHCAIK